MNIFVTLFCLAVSVLAAGAELQLELNQTVSLQVTRDQPASLSLNLNASTQVRLVAITSCI